MKLFVWENPFPTSYSGDWVIAVADNIEEAKEIAGSKIITSIYHPEARAECLGDPDQVLDLPAAEWFHWEK